MRRLLPALAACLIGAPAVLAQTNVLFNPGWESTSGPGIFQGWSNFGNVYREHIAAVSGLWGVKMFGNFWGVTNYSGVTQDLPAGPNQNWSATVIGHQVAGDALQGGNRAVIKFDYVAADNSIISSSTDTTVLDATSPTDTLISATVNGLTPDGTAVVRVAIVFIQQADNAGGAALFDDVTVTRVESPAPAVVNPGFENAGGANWAQFNFAGRSTILPRTGVAGVTTGGLNNGAFNVNGVFQDAPAAPGQVWVGTAYIQSTSLVNPLQGDDWAVLNIEWHNAAGDMISYDSVTAANSTTTPDEWHLVTVTGTAPIGTTAARIVALYLNPPQTGVVGQVFWDDFDLHQVVPASCNVADICGIGGPPSTPDGILTGDDFNAFINAFANSDPLADICGIGGPPSAPDGLVTGDDFNAFINAFATGCP